MLNKYDTILYDTIYLYLRALKSWRNGQLSLARTAQKQKKIKEKLKTTTD